MKLYCIGGGDPRDARMVEHYGYIGNLARQNIATDRAPKIALLPTAHRNGTHPKLQALDFIVEEFARSGCTTEQILLGEVPSGKIETSSDDIRRILGEADALFVLGGDTRYLLNTLTERQLVPIFQKSLNSGLMFSGSSAGTIWLAQEAMSDSESFIKPEGWNFIMLKGLEVLPFIMNVHDDQGIPAGAAAQVSRAEQFEQNFLMSDKQLALAIDEFVALEIREGICTVRSPGANKGAYLLGKIDGSLVRRKLAGSLDLNNGDTLLNYLRV